MAFSIEQMVQKQVGKVLARGQRFEKFDQLRTRHFWSTYLFAYGAGNTIAAGPYDIFKVIPSMSGQGYPAGTPLTLRETNWRNPGRVPDNQNFAVTEIGVSVLRPPPVDTDGQGGVPLNAPANGIYANLSPAIQALIAPQRAIHPQDAASILYGTVLEMSYLTNNIPMGLASDYSQGGGLFAQEQLAEAAGTNNQMGDATNGVPCMALRRKFEVPILLQHGEAMGMVLRVPSSIQTLSLAQGGAGWAEIRVDWWAVESFVEKS